MGLADDLEVWLHSRNARPAKTETALVLSARPLSMVLDHVGDIGEPGRASRLREERSEGCEYNDVSALVWHSLNEIMEDVMAVRKRELTVMHPNAAGIDIGSASHYVAVAPDQSAEPVKEFGCFTEDLEAMADGRSRAAWTWWRWNRRGCTG